jgi:hypothetical protein
VSWGLQRTLKGGFRYLSSLASIRWSLRDRQSALARRPRSELGHLKT